MAALTPIGYPYKCSMATGSYKIIVGTDTIYQGNAYSFPGESKISYDLSSMMRNYISCPDFTTHFNSTSVIETNGQVYDTTLIDSNGTFFNPKYVWNYSPKTRNLLNENYVVSDYPTPWIYPGQRVPFSVIGYKDVQYNVNLATSLTDYTLIELPYNSSTSIDVRTFTFTMGSVVSDKENTGSWLEFKKSSDETILTELNIKGCIPDNAYTVYYINLKGGLSYVHCTGKNTLKSAITRNQITHEPDYSTPYQHSQTNYLNQRNLTWILNTPLLNNKNSKLLQELFSSPRVWVYSYSEGIFRSAIITDSTVEEKNRLNNHLFNYTINLKESQTYSILA